MAACGDVGAFCAFCGSQDFLPLKCNGCSEAFCKDHAALEAHSCPSSLGKEQEVRVAPTEAAKLQRCAAPGCRESLSAHNRVTCWRCHQDVCIKHRFEDCHPCMSTEAAVSAALAQAAKEMTADELTEAHKTLTKVFGNIIADPTNEKYRTLKKANAVVKEKLRHPCCIEALKLSGFQDMGEAYVCRSAADLSTMKQMAAALKEAGSSSSLAQKTQPGPSQGPTIVNGVITRPVKTEAKADPLERRGVALPKTASAPPAGTPVGPYPSAKGKPRSAFDFQNRRVQEQSVQSAQSAVQDLRKLQKERYQGEQSASGATGSDAVEQRSPQSNPNAEREKQGSEKGGDCVTQ